MNLLFITTLLTNVLGFSPFRNWVLYNYLPKYQNVDDWWDNPIIHNVGNTGLGGTFHAEMAPHFTKLIDYKAYNNRDIRYEISKEISSNFDDENVTIVDFGCGVGMSTKALQKAFINKNYRIYGVDTSNQMLEKAKQINYHKNILYTNENIINSPVKHLENKVDVVNIMFLLHEVPLVGHYQIIDAAYNLLKENGKLYITDIHEGYNPSSLMLTGEPYLLEYKKYIRRTLEDVVKTNRFRLMNKTDDCLNSYVPNHVSTSRLTKNTNRPSTALKGRVNDYLDIFDNTNYRNNTYESEKKEGKKKFIDIDTFYNFVGIFIKKLLSNCIMDEDCDLYELCCDYGVYNMCCSGTYMSSMILSPLFLNVEYDDFNLITYQEYLNRQNKLIKNNQTKYNERWLKTLNDIWG